MNTATKVLIAMLPNPNWELFAAAATVLAASFAVCFLGMLSQMLTQDAPPPPRLDDQAGEALLQEANGARVLRAASQR